MTPPARTSSQMERPASFKLGSPLKLSTEKVASYSSTENVFGSPYDPPPVLVPKLSLIAASTTKLYPKPAIVHPVLSDTAFLGKGRVEE